MTDLEQSMEDIALAYDFYRFDIGYRTSVESAPYFFVTAWWHDDAAPHRVQCVNGTGETIAKAVVAAIAAASRKRAPQIVEEAIRLGEAA